jgi:hypothetical protein
MQYWEIVADKLSALVGRGVIAVRSHRTDGVGSLAPTAKVADTLCILTNW